MGEPVKRKSRVAAVLEVVLMLDDDELWEFVCRMLPKAEEETLEDVYDVLVALKNEDEPTVSFEEVFGRTPEEVRGE